jgi:hypothetical protein
VKKERATIVAAYANAARMTGKTLFELEKMAEEVFGTMLHHALKNPAETVWTVTIVEPGHLSVEVNFAPRNWKGPSVQGGGSEGN